MLTEERVREIVREELAEAVARITDPEQIRAAAREAMDEAFAALTEAIDRADPLVGRRGLAESAEPVHLAT